MEIADEPMQCATSIIIFAEFVVDQHVVLQDEGTRGFHGMSSHGRPSNFGQKPRSRFRSVSNSQTTLPFRRCTAGDRCAHMQACWHSEKRWIHLSPLWH